MAHNRTAVAVTIDRPTAGRCSGYYWLARREWKLASGAYTSFISLSLPDVIVGVNYMMDSGDSVKSMNLVWYLSGIESQFHEVQ